ncbi:trans-aconitate methyltransferase [Arthrobacter alpinus]|uniref:Trans-aconitate 2-methyltransferase n=1 Tax=Arthrobacter alpinus TaxID=656366 RepID=A0A0S2LZI5_9MICC|nr:trans-aconitate 2-methyltransferase [Arthrobacter alpinus]ALO66915.1 trans-aconitate methyltransferase [Arthrobacter alpinus]
MTDQPFLWEPAQYRKFGDFRDRPFFDLTARIGAVAPARVVDLGCGPGNLTATLAQRWPQASVLGLDSSAAMVAQARALIPAASTGSRSTGAGASAAPTHSADDGGTPSAASPHIAPGLAFVQGDIAAWVPTSDTDVIVSNAALQWIPQHRELMAGWLAAMHPGAWLGVQVPGNFGAPSHVLMRELAESPRWRKQLGGVLRHEDAVAEPALYQELFLSCGARVDVWETTYSHLLQGKNPVLEWVRGTALRPVLGALSLSEAMAFEHEYAALLAKAYPAGEYGSNFEFRRIFMVGEKQ